MQKQYQANNANDNKPSHVSIQPTEIETGRQVGRTAQLGKQNRTGTSSNEEDAGAARRTCIDGRRARRWRAWAWRGGCSARRATAGCRWRCCSGCRPATAPSPARRRGPTARTPPPWRIPTLPLPVAPHRSPSGGDAINPPGVYGYGERDGEGRSAPRIWLM